MKISLYYIKAYKFNFYNTFIIIYKETKNNDSLITKDIIQFCNIIGKRKLEIQIKKMFKYLLKENKIY